MVSSTAMKRASDPANQINVAITEAAITEAAVTEAAVAIVGAGPIGIELAAALRQRNLSVLHFDAGAIGATIDWYPPRTHFFSSPERIAICGVPLQTLDQTKATREEYLTYLRTVVQQFDLKIHTFERVVDARRQESGFLLTTRRGHDHSPVHGLRPAGTGVTHRYRVGKLVLAIGDMHRPRRLDIAGEELPHVSHYCSDPHHYFGSRVLVVGGKNSAVEAAIRCSRAGAKVTISYRRDDFNPRVKYWLLPEIRALVRDGLVDFLPSTQPREILPDRVVLDTPSSTMEVPADFVLLLTGYAQDSELFTRLGVDLHGPGQQPVWDEATMETNVPGVFVAGTASAGTQLSPVTAFIETCHVHVNRIVGALTGEAAGPTIAPHYEMPES